MLAAYGASEMYGERGIRGTSFMLISTECISLTRTDLPSVGPWHPPGRSTRSLLSGATELRQQIRVPELNAFDGSRSYRVEQGSFNG